MYTLGLKKNLQGDLIKNKKFGNIAKKYLSIWINL